MDDWIRRTATLTHNLENANNPDRFWTEIGRFPDLASTAGSVGMPGMSFADALWLFGIMVVLAATPSASVALVVSRSAVYGVRSGAAVAAGTFSIRA